MGQEWCAKRSTCADQELALYLEFELSSLREWTSTPGRVMNYMDLLDMWADMDVRGAGHWAELRLTVLLSSHWMAKHGVGGHVTKLHKTSNPLFNVSCVSFMLSMYQYHPDMSFF